VRFLLVLLFVLFPCATFAVVPEAIQQIIKKDFPKAIFRIDDCFEENKNLWILIKPSSENLQEVLELSFKNADEYLFSNNWIYVKVSDNTIKSFDSLSKPIQSKILSSQITQEFVIPNKFSLPRDLAVLAGRLPIELNAVELATEKEVIYRKRLLEQKSTEPFRFFTYDVHSGDFSLLSLERGLKSDKPSQLERSESISKKLKYLSNIKLINDEVYLSDLYQSKIYKISKTSPDLELVLDLNDYLPKQGIRDFVFNHNFSEIFVLTNKDSSLLVIDLNKKQLIKQNTIAPMVAKLQMLSRSASEPEYLYYFSKATNKIYYLSTFDYRVAGEIDISKIESDHKLVPYSMIVTDKTIYLGVESFDLKKSTQQAEILEFDMVTGQHILTVALPVLPDLIKYGGQSNLYVLGRNDQKHSKLVEISLLDNTLKELDLYPDLDSANDFVVDSASSLIFIPSIESKVLNIVDVKSFSLVQKIQLEKSIFNIVRI
jgi:hypothetical protein